ncbi:MAG: Ferrous iron transport protein B [Candidatus Gottesmanbacteria bacterium GW2011_GWC2_39_8]|uniref:Ferrous iron transport protein B n=1 Tax=Candidatus Gottesmanbacteria bacterium GW2011_GWC2_39_8 TaxID=1618450 RepID=A0A0G0PU13_9BACT|nr:MAG: Ferrous iron transport protein B [Candidatus Gottesmanbacteria bacterium GW2011_GWC2_39_8]
MIFDRLSKKHQTKSCCREEIIDVNNDTPKVILVGSPNVGKSVIFNSLTGSYATVSNYPGTTVTLSKANISLNGKQVEIIDSPGVYSLFTITEEEMVTRNLIFKANPRVLVHVIDAKNLERMLPLTLQLLETGFPMILVLNLIDEAEKLGLTVDIRKLTSIFGIPVITAVAVKNIGIKELSDNISSLIDNPKISKFKFDYGLALEKKISEKGIGIGRAKRLLELQSDSSETGQQPLIYQIAVIRQRWATETAQQVLSKNENGRKSFSHVLSGIFTSPITGFPILLLFLYFGLYKLIGQFVAGNVVNFIENNIFGTIINPFFRTIIPKIIPFPVFQDLFVGNYGILTTGVRYAIAIILPIVSSFFFLFAILEDSGYLPRMAMLIDKIFKRIGLSGRAVIPLILGLGCSSMATMVTRTLPTKRERVIATLMLALAIPCSAQLGVLMALLTGQSGAMLVWTITILIIFLTVGFLGAQILPGDKPLFYMEIPPLRIPSLGNIWHKTSSRVSWYFLEVFPLFIIASFFLWLGNITGVLNMLVNIMNVPVSMIGLPKETGVAYIFGFFRRDYGAAGLYDIYKSGLMNVNQLTIAVVTMTLFPACIAQALMMAKERGRLTGTAIFAVCISIAFIAGLLLKNIFNIFSITL